MAPSSGPGPHGADAPRPGVIPLRPLRLPEITEGAVATLRVHARVVLGTSVGIAVVAAVLVFCAETYLTSPAESPAGGVVVDGASLLIRLLAHALAVGVLTLVVGRAVLGSPITGRRVRAELAPLLPALLGLTVVVTAATAAGLALLIVPGIVAYVFLALAAPALVRERCGVTTALRRSVQLVRGDAWRVFGLLLLALLITVLVGMVVQLLVAQLLPLGAGTPALADGTLVGHRLILGAGDVLMQTFTLPLSAAMTTLIYLDRRMRREDLAAELRRAARSGE